MPRMPPFWATTNLSGFLAASSLRESDVKPGTNTLLSRLASPAKGIDTCVRTSCRAMFSTASGVDQGLSVFSKGFYQKCPIAVKGLDAAAA